MHSTGLLLYFENFIFIKYSLVFSLQICLLCYLEVSCLVKMYSLMANFSFPTPHFYNIIMLASFFLSSAFLLSSVVCNCHFPSHFSYIRSSKLGIHPLSVLCMLLIFSTCFSSVFYTTAKPFFDKSKVAIINSVRVIFFPFLPVCILTRLNQALSVL